LTIKQQVLQAELRSLWYDLSPSTRASVLGDQASDKRQRPNDGGLIIDGYLSAAGAVIRPTWLAAVGKAAGLVPPQATGGLDVSGFAVAERVHSLLNAINADLLGRSLPLGFEPSSETLRWGRLVREVRGEEDVAWCVNHLSKIVYEGARRKDGEDRWQLPPN